MTKNHESVASEIQFTAARSYRISPDLDLALIDVPRELQLPPLKARKSGVKTGERIFAIGFPLGLNKSITQGIVSSETDELVQFDAPISSGNSGGPLVDKTGEVLGVVTSGSTGDGSHVIQNLNLAINIAFVPKAELFREPIVRFYDAWRELVKLQNKLIQEVQDQVVFDVEECVMTEATLPLLFVLEPRFATAEPEKRRAIEAFMKSQNSDALARVVKRHGSVEAGVKAVVPFLRSRVSQFDKIPGMFAGLGSDELLRRFGHDMRKKTLFKWDVKPSEIVPLLKTSAEFAKAIPKQNG